MDEKTYMTEVLRTYAGKDTQQDKLLLSALGLAGESGEVVDHIKKVLFAGHELDSPHLKEELGDILWYIVLACDALNCSLEDIITLNVEKIRKRYPNGFEAERSRNRQEERAETR